MRNFHSKTITTLLLVGVVISSLLWQPASSHGRLWTPPARGTMWRRGFNTPTNYQDNEMFCGGFSHQVQLGGNCGICGDPWDYEGNRPHEAGGTYATGTIAEVYKQGDLAILQVQITANHKGWFTFKICPTNSPDIKATQPCLDQYTLQLTDGSGTKLYVERFGTGMVNIPVWLPANLTCQYCVLQWRYHTGNSWGEDPDGRGCVGCGPQEEFYGCSDIRILPGDGSPVNTYQPPPATTVPPATTTTTPTTTTTTTEPTTQRTSPQTQAPPTTTVPTTTETSSGGSVNGNQGGVNGPIPTTLSCTALRANLGNWCDDNCNLGFCPATHCRCVTIVEPRFLSGLLRPGCYAKTFWNLPGRDAWCSNNCAAGNCLANRCFCISYLNAA